MKQIEFNVWPNAYLKGGESCNVKDIHEIIKINPRNKEEQPCLQVFNTGYRVISDNIDWNNWNGCVFVDIDSKHYYNEVKKFDTEKLYDALYNELIYSSNFYNLHKSWSGTSYHIIFYFNVEKNEINFNKCVQRSREITFECFEEIGCDKILNYKNVLDKCTISPYQCMFFNQKSSKYYADFMENKLGDFDICDIDKYELVDKYEVKVNDVNKDRTINFVYNGKKEISIKNKQEAHHRKRMAIYMSLISVFNDREKVNNEWKTICEKYIECPKYTSEKMYKDAIKNNWFDKYDRYTHFANSDVLKPFGYKLYKKFVPTINKDNYKADYVVNLNSDQYLADIDMTKYLKEDKINHIFAGCGFGKTYWAKKLAENNRVCFISPLTSIINDSFGDDNSNFIIVDSKHKEENNYIYNGIQNIVYRSGNISICTTWESFVNYKMYYIYFDYIIIDEAHTLYMYDYRLESSYNIRRFFKVADAKYKILMTGTPSLEIQEFNKYIVRVNEDKTNDEKNKEEENKEDKKEEEKKEENKEDKKEEKKEENWCNKIKIIKEQPRVKCEIIGYKNNIKGYIINDIKEWIKDDNHYAVVFKDTANHKDVENFEWEGIESFIFNSKYKENVEEMINTKTLTNKVTIISVYGQAGINIHTDDNQKVRLYIQNYNGLAAIQYANRIRNKKSIDKVVIPVKKDIISNDIKRLSMFNKKELKSLLEDANKKIDIINSSIIDRKDIFSSDLYMKFIYRLGLKNDFLYKIDNELRLDENNYITYKEMMKVNEYENQVQVLYNRLIDNYFDVDVKYLDNDINTNNETKNRSNQFSGAMKRFDMNKVKRNHNNEKLYIDTTNNKIMHFLTGDLKQTIENILNLLDKHNGGKYESFIDIIVNVIKDKGSISKIDIKHLYCLLDLNFKWNDYYDNAFVYVMQNNNWDDFKITAALVRSMYNDVNKVCWEEISDEMYVKVCNVRKTLNYAKYVEDIIKVEFENPNKLNIENDDITAMIYTYLVNNHTKSKNRCKKIEFEGKVYNSIKEAEEITGKSRSTIKRHMKYLDD